MRLLHTLILCLALVALGRVAHGQPVETPVSSGDATTTFDGAIAPDAGEAPPAPRADELFAADEPSGGAVNEPSGGEFDANDEPSGGVFNEPSRGRLAVPNEPSGGAFAVPNEPSGGRLAEYDEPSGGGVNEPSGGDADELFSEDDDGDGVVEDDAILDDGPTTCVAAQVRGVRARNVGDLCPLLGSRPGGQSAMNRWIRSIAARVEDDYRALGYRYVSVVGHIEDGVPTLDVDEGRIHHVAFVGASFYERLVFLDEMRLPRSVFRRDLVEARIEALQDKYNLRAIDWEVRESTRRYADPWGHPRPQRVLYVYIGGDGTGARTGFRFDVALESVRGMVATVGWDRRPVFGDDDYLGTSVSVALPYRQFAVEESPKFRWVYGDIELEYRAPTLGLSPIAPTTRGTASVTRLSRNAIGIDRVYVLRVDALELVRIEAERGIAIELGAGVEHFDTYGLQLLEDATPPLDPRQTRPTVGVRLLAESTRMRALRTDLTNRLDWTVRTSFPAGGYLLDAGFLARGVHVHGPVTFVHRARVALVQGRVRFYDERRLGSVAQRVFFDNRFWVREAAQYELGLRFNLSRTVDVGLFHDFSVFGDRTGGTPEVALANAFGPSVHVIIRDQFGLDVYYGFGFAPGGESHNANLSFAYLF